jgi:hypothetical protein
VDPSEAEDWLSARKPAYLKWMKILAVLAIALNAVAEIHYGQITGLRLPSTVAPVVSYLAAASASLFATGVVLGVALYFNERRRRR